jgi:predicted amidohydrolase YtcJ
MMNAIWCRQVITGGLLLAAAACALPAAAKEKADLILHHGKVLTVDPAFSVKSVVVVKGDKILAVGGEDLRAKYEGAKEIDLRGRTLMPGFTDTHLHPIPVAPSDIDVASARSVAEVQDMLRRKAAQLGPGKWITGYGWQESNFAEKRNLSLADLDAASPDNPVLLVRAGAHSSVSNTAAFKIAGIDRNTPDPKSGLIEHDANGALNGVIRERTDLIRKFIPPASWDEMRPAYVVWLKKILSLGITSFFNASGTIDDEPIGKGGIENPPPNLTFRRARALYAEMGDSLPRMTMYIAHPGAERLRAFGLHTGYGDTRVRLGAIGEMAVDGGFTGPTAWLLADYKGQPGFRGKGRFTDAELQETIDSAARLGWQMGLHAIGDAAIVQTVDAYAKSLASTGLGKKDHRWFLDHFTIMPPDATMATMKRDAIMIAQQPNFLYNLEDRYEQTLDDWRLTHNNAVATPAHRFGLFVAFGSDNLPINPMVGLYAAITRKGPSGRAHGPKEEGVSREEAIRMYTANGPVLSWEEKIKGTIEPGKLADMIVLPFDPLTAAPDTLLAGKVDMTFVGGKLVYERQ